MLVSSCRCCMFVSCVHPVQVLRAGFCMTCSLLMLVGGAIGDQLDEAYLIQSRSHAGADWTVGKSVIYRIKFTKKKKKKKKKKRKNIKKRNKRKNIKKENS